jgi:SAM-dependent methyltransferase
MSGFSSSWLALREAADHRSRNEDLAETLKTRFLQREQIHVMDLGCGTGSNLRATSGLLPNIQHWTLIDHDPALLAAAKRELMGWAIDHDVFADKLVMRRDNKRITAVFHQADLARDLDTVLDLDPKLDLVTASALFDLVSSTFIQRFAAAIAKRRVVFYTTLTYNGIQRWLPRTPNDQQMNGAFHHHQVMDKGFGAACGPTAAVELFEQFETHGFSIAEGDSPWKLGPADHKLIAELAIGFAAAVRQTKALSDSDIDKWIARPRTNAEVGHTDTLAVPGSGSGRIERDVKDDEPDDE